MNQMLEAAIEQLRWQFEHDPLKDSPEGAACAMCKDSPDAPAECLILYAWGIAAETIYRILKAHDMGPEASNGRTFPPKPNLN